MKQGIIKMTVCTLLAVLCLGLGSCKKLKGVISKAVSSQETEMPTKHFKLEGGSKYQDSEAKFTLDMDYPQGDSKAAIMLRRLFYEMSMEGPCTEDIQDGQVMFDKLLAKYKEANSPENMKQELEEGIGDGWYYNIRFKKEWENENVISYTYSADAFNVGNATSSAWIKDITLSKADGRLLGWEMFKSKADVKAVIDDLLVTKYGREGADMYDQGIPMPDAPLFLGNGIRFDYGDYSIVSPHIYEDTGEYPCCLLTYEPYQNLLTDEARELLGLKKGETSNAGPTAPSSSNNAQQDDAFFIQLVKAWDKLHNEKRYDDYENCLYTENVRFYGSTLNGHDAARQVQSALLDNPDYYQNSEQIRIYRENSKRVRCDFEKHTTQSGKKRMYPSYLIFTEVNGVWLIAEESDAVTDSNLSKRKNN